MTYLYPAGQGASLTPRDGFTIARHLGEHMASLPLGPDRDRIGRMIRLLKPELQEITREAWSAGECAH